MTARAGAPPRNVAGARGTTGAGGVERLSGGRTTSILAHPTNDRPNRDVESYLRGLIRSCPNDVPLIGDLTADDLGTPRATASIARAALAWYREGLEDDVRERLEQDLRANDFLVAWRLRRMSGDLAEVEDWAAVASLTPIAELQRLRLYETEAVA